VSETTGTTSAQGGSATPDEAAARWARKAHGATRRYRVMAWITGTLLLVLCVEMLLKYVVHAPDDVMRWIEWVPFAHGWVYVVYLVTVFDLWATMRWRVGRLVTMAIAGVVPVMSFVLERTVHTQALAAIEAARSGTRASVEG
jgi:integral membrane protein